MFKFNKNLEYKIKDPGVYLITYNHSLGVIYNTICCIVSISNYEQVTGYIEPIYIFGDNTRVYSFKYDPYTHILKKNQNSGLDLSYSLIKLI